MRNTTAKCYCSACRIFVLNCKIMKQPFLFLFGVLFFIKAGAQVPIDSVAYNKGLYLIESAATVQDYITAGNYFDELSSSKPTEWLAPLYAGLSYVLASRKESDTRMKDKLCDQAQARIDSANSRHADTSESAALQAFLYQARIDVNPTERALEYSLKADAEIKKSEARNPDDPRPYFLYAMNVYYTPKIFGGGPEKALPLFEKAAGKFTAFQPELPFMPHWGEQQNLEMIAKCKSAEGGQENK